MLYLQYQKAARLKALIDQLSPILTIAENDFYTNFFNIETCNGDGLDNWGSILGQSRSIAVSDNDNFLGFYKDTDTWLPKPKNFNHGTFYQNRELPEQNLLDEPYRQLLLLIYGNQVTNNSVGGCCRLLNYYYHSISTTKKVKVDENVVEMMSIRYLFNFVLENYERSIFNVLIGALPRPVGVSITYVEEAF
jgi:hypothetical protein